MIFSLPIALFAIQVLCVICCLLVVIFSFHLLLVLALVMANLFLYAILLKVTKDPHFLETGFAFPKSISNKKVTPLR
jgi:hypothetical protein